MELQRFWKTVWSAHLVALFSALGFLSHCGLPSQQDRGLSRRARAPRARCSWPLQTRQARFVTAMNRGGGAEATGPESSRTVEAGADSGGRDQTGADMVALTGHVTIRSGSGEPLNEESGNLRLMVWTPGSYRVEEIQVTKGNWEVMLPRDAELMVRDLRLGGSFAYSDVPRQRIPEGRFLDVEACRPPPSVLRVIDFETGADLSSVRVLTTPKTRGGDEIYPSAVVADQVVFERAQSPITLPAQYKKQVWWVHAPGYTWRSVMIDHVEGGERQVYLRPSASALIHIENYDWERNPGAVARLTRQGEIERRKPVVELPLPSIGNELLIYGIEAGSYLLRFEEGPWWKRPTRLAEAKLELRAKETLEITVRLSGGSEESRLVELTGVLEIPSAWHGEANRLVLFPLETRAANQVKNVYIPITEMDEIEGRSGSYRWSAGKVQPGRYLASVQSLEVFECIEVRPSGPAELHIQVPPPGELRVRIVDASTGAAVPLPALRWYRALPDGVSNYYEYLKQTIPGPEEGVFTFNAPAGEIVLVIDYGVYREREEVISVVPGGLDYTVALEHATVVRLTLKDGETTIPLDWEVDFELRPLSGGAGGIRRLDVDGASLLAIVSQPGEYQVHLPQFHGFQPTPRQIVRAESGKLTDVEIKLNRLE